MSHQCHAEGCTAQVPPRMFACRRHWHMVPKWLQGALWSAYRPGQESDKRVTDQYKAVQVRCRIAIATHEGNMAAATLTAWLATRLRGSMTADYSEFSDYEVVDVLDKVLQGAAQ